MLSGQSMVAKSIGDLLKSGFESDAVIIAEEKELKVHSLIIYACCETLFQELKAANNKLTLKFSYKSVLAFLQYIYSGNFLFSHDTTEIMEIYKISETYKMAHLKTTIIFKLTTYLSTENFIKIATLASDNSDVELTSVVKNFFRNHLADILQRDDWVKFRNEYKVAALSLIETLNDCSSSQHNSQ